MSPAYTLTCCMHWVSV